MDRGKSSLAKLSVMENLKLYYGSEIDLILCPQVNFHHWSPYNNSEVGTELNENATTPAFPCLHFSTLGVQLEPPVVFFTFHYTARQTDRKLNLTLMS